VLPTDIVRVRLRLVDMYEAYTSNTELVRDHLARALKAVSTNSAVASRKINSIRWVSSCGLARVIRTV